MKKTERTHLGVNKKILKNKRYILLSFVLMFVIGTIYYAIQTTSQGLELSKLKESEVELVQLNEDLVNKIANSTSLTRVSEDAEKLGFDKPAKIIYLSSFKSVAKLP